MIDLKDLEKALRAMKPRTVLYDLIKREMIRRDRWKVKPRGKSFSRGYDNRRRG